LTRTLTELRLFTDARGTSQPGGEIHAWRSTLGWQAVEAIDLAATDPPAAKEEALSVIDTEQILFGTEIEHTAEGFSVVREGQGLRHAVPMTLEDGQFGEGILRPLRLHVREYISADAQGVCRITSSRLSGLSIKVG
jgi:CRISPR-associated protein (TIGR03984 family)